MNPTTGAGPSGSFVTDQAAFERDGLSFAGGAPGAVLLLGAEEREAAWSATPAPAGPARPRQTPLGAAEEHSAAWRFLDGFRLEWRVMRLLRWPGFTVRAVFRNDSPAPVRLRRLDMLQAPAPALQAEAGDWFLMAPFAGAKVPEEGPLAGFTRGERRFQDCLSLYSRQGERGVFVAPVGPAESDVTLALAAGGGGYGLAVHSDMTDVVVEPGESRASEEVLFLFVPQREAFEAAMRWIAATHGARLHRGPFTGWCSWYEQYSNVSAAHVRAVADFVSRHRDAVPQRVIQIDEGYQRKWGDWRVNERFPEGWKPVVESIRAAGAVPGVWLAPLGVFESTGLLAEQPDWFQVEANAIEPVKGEWRNDTIRYLDPTHPGARRFIREIVRNALAEGFRYFKIDFNNVVQARFHDPKATRFQALRGLYRLYREEMGEDVYLNACVFSLKRAVLGHADAMRIGGDSEYRWSWIKEAICAAGHAAPANGIGMAADPDVFYTRLRPGSEALTIEQLRSWHGFAALLGGVTMTSDPIHRPDYKDSLRELEIVTPPVPERGGSFLPGMESHPSLFGFVADRAWGRFAAVLLFNARETAGAVALNAPALNALGECHLWSFRDGLYLGRATGTHVESNLPPWGSRLLRLTPVEPEGKPVLIGSDLHIGMGAAEIAAWVVTADTVEIGLTDAGARAGALWVYSEKPVALEAAERCQAAVEADGPTLWRIRLTDRQRGRGQTVRLAVGRVPRQAVAPVTDAGPEAAVRFTLTAVANPTFAMQGQSIRNGQASLSIANRGPGAVSGTVRLVASQEGSLAFAPDAVDYALKAGEAIVRSVTIEPRRHVPRFTVAVCRAGVTRGLAWAEFAMERLALRIPAAADSWEALREAAEAEGVVGLLGAPALAELRLAASGRNLFVDIRVRDPQPAPNPEPFWVGSCVELLAARADESGLVHLYFHPDAAAGAVRSFVIGAREREEACPAVRAEVARMAEGYALRILCGFDRLGLPAGERAFLLDFQVSRRLNGVVQNVPLLGGPGGHSSSRLYARVSVGV